MVVPVAPQEHFVLEMAGSGPGSPPHPRQEKKVLHPSPSVLENGTPRVDQESLAARRAEAAWPGREAPRGETAQGTGPSVPGPQGGEHLAPNHEGPGGAEDPVLEEAAEPGTDQTRPWR